MKIIRLMAAKLLRKENADPADPLLPYTNKRDNYGYTFTHGATVSLLKCDHITCVGPHLVFVAILKFQVPPPELEIRCR